MMEAWQQIGGKNEIHLGSNHTGTLVPEPIPIPVRLYHAGDIQYSGTSSVVYGTGTAVPLR